METLKKINFDSEVTPFSLSEFNNNKLKQNIKAPLRLGEVELKNVLGVISLLQINSEYLKTERDLQNFLDIILGGDDKFLNNNHAYIIKLFPEIDECYKEDFNYFLNQTFDRSNLFDNPNLRDFCSEAIVDTISLERLWEFGMYNIHKMSNEVFKNITEEERKGFINENVRDIDLSKAVIDGLKKMNTSLLDYHISLLLILFHYQIHKRSFGIKRALYMGSSMLRNNIYYRNIANEIQPHIKSLVGIIMTNERNNNLNRGKGWTSY